MNSIRFLCYLLLGLMVIGSWWSFQVSEVGQSENAEVAAGPIDRSPKSVIKPLTIGVSDSKPLLCPIHENCLNIKIEAVAVITPHIGEKIQLHAKAIASGNLSAAVEAGQDILECIQTRKALWVLAQAQQKLYQDNPSACSESQADYVIQQTESLLNSKFGNDFQTPSVVEARLAWLEALAVFDDERMGQDNYQVIQLSHGPSVTYSPAPRRSQYWAQHKALLNNRVPLN